MGSKKVTWLQIKRWPIHINVDTLVETSSLWKPFLWFFQYSFNLLHAIALTHQYKVQEWISIKWTLFSLKWIPFSLSQVNADIPAIEKAIQASGSKVRTHSLFLIPFLKRLTTLIHVKRQSYIILISPPLACLKNLLCQVKMSGEDLKACVLEIQEVLVAWTVSCLVILP